MTERSADIQQSIAVSPSPGEEFRTLPWAHQREVFFQFPESIQQAVVEDMDRHQLYRFVRRLDPDEATDVLGFATEKTQEAILRRLDDDRRTKIEFLLEFSPESAAGMMHLDYVTVESARSFRDVTARVRRYENRTGRFPRIFVTRDGTLLGELPGQALAMANADSEAITDYLHETPTVGFDSEQEEVLEVFRANPESTVAVLDEDETILGVIYAEDLLRLVEEEASNTLYEFTGVVEEESILDGPLAKIRNRYKWLIVNLGTAFLAAAVVGLFEDTIAAFTLLAVYMPVVAGMGGNAGTQSMAVTVRGLAFGQVSLSTGGRAVFNEILAGGANGAITGVIVAVIAAVFNQSPLLGVVLGVSMVLNLVIAGFFGTAIPLVLDRLEIDPATSATIFITTATDVLGFFVFLGLARTVLGI
ncbi:divalent cation transporter [Halalkalicoccus paucihalophilus]|uniref:Divalent cation transporter n=1 Tax=Halalkalicoccus paucihalophilus TaxID=1008153 RepID=A0A151AE32_9EURY|nr:magnesium transporter [Halalkalicoccus paucihalophilus]KYH25928.1 divalent cation transporter [Halalkalicoccus paucihalophilus]